MLPKETIFAHNSTALLVCKAMGIDLVRYPTTTASIGVGTRGAEGARAPPTFLASTHVYIIHLLQPRAALA